MARRKLHPRTVAIRTQVDRTAQHEHSVPLYLTSSYLFDSLEHGRALFAKEAAGNIYGRYHNPNAREFADKITALESAEAGLAFASGMAALFAALLGLLEQGQRIVASSCLFGSTLQILTRLLPKWGIECTLVNPSATMETWERAFAPGTRLCLIETPSNPLMDIIDIRALADLCRARDAVLLVDNAYATPVLQNPIALGAHLVMHTGTKYIDGQGRVLGGVLVGEQPLIEPLETFLRHTGPTLSPFNAWVLSKSLETLHLRVHEHCANALQLARFLEGHKQVEWVRYPQLPSHPQHELAARQMRRGGGIITFHLRKPKIAAFIDGLEMCSRSANLGDTRTIVTHPRSTTHSSITEEERLAIGITGKLVRISAGLEHIDDIIADVDQALARLDSPTRVSS